MKMRRQGGQNSYKTALNSNKNRCENAKKGVETVKTGVNQVLRQGCLNSS